LDAPTYLSLPEKKVIFVWPGGAFFLSPLGSDLLPRGPSFPDVSLSVTDTCFLYLQKEGFLIIPVLPKPVCKRLAFSRLNLTISPLYEVVL